MKIVASELENLKILEETLWPSETRFDLAHQEKTFAPDFLSLVAQGEDRLESKW